MQTATVCLTDELKREIERIAAEQGRSEAEIIDIAIRLFLAFQGPNDPPLPSFGLFDSGDPDFASRTDEMLEGFGEH